VLGEVQRWLEAVYRVGAPDVEDFVVDDAQLDAVRPAAAARPADEWVLVREGPDGVDLAVWVDARHQAALAAAGSLPAAVEACFPAVCAAVEGVSHFLLLVERARRAEPVSLLELEAQAEVDKFICARLHHPDRGREWHARLFRDARLHDGLSEDEAWRYREAGRLAAGLCARLDRHRHAAAILDEVRAFWRSSGGARLDRMRRLAAGRAA